MHNRVMLDGEQKTSPRQKDWLLSDACTMHAACCLRLAERKGAEPVTKLALSHGRERNVWITSELFFDSRP